MIRPVWPTINNAGKVRQRGAELEATFQAADILELHGAMAYTHNRFRDFIGQCYGYDFSTGTVRATAVAPADCYLVNAAALTLQQDFNGRPPARSPDWAGNAGFVFDIPNGSIKVGISGDAFFSDGYFSAETMASSTYQNSFVRLNASISLAQVDDQWSVGLIAAT